MKLTKIPVLAHYQQMTLTLTLTRLCFVAYRIMETGIETMETGIKIETGKERSRAKVRKQYR